MTGAAPMLKVGQGFGTWLIPIIIFGVLGSVAIMSLIVLVCAYYCRSRRRITDRKPQMTHEIYRTPTMPYKNPSVRPVDPTIGRLVTHSRSLHVPRNQTINTHRLRPQVSSPELRNTSQPPPYPYRTTPVPSPRRYPRPQGQVYFDRIIDPGHICPIPQRSLQLPPSLENLPTRPERCFSASSPSSYSSSCMSVEGIAFTEAFSSPSSPSISSQESLAPARTLSWIAFSESHRHSGPDSNNPSSLLNHNKLTIISDHHETKKLTSARPRHRSEAGGPAVRTGQNNRRLIIVDDNLVGGDSEVPSDGFGTHALRQAQVIRLVRGTQDKTNAPFGEEDEGTKEAEVGKPSCVGSKTDWHAMFKVVCPDTNDLWKMPAILGETLDEFAGRVKQRTGGDVILFVNEEILANEEDWKALGGGGRITAHLIR